MIQKQSDNSMQTFSFPKIQITLPKIIQYYYSKYSVNIIDQNARLYYIP